MCAPVACVAVTWLVRCPPSLRRLELRDWVPPCVAGDAFFGCGEMDTPLEIKPAWPIWLSGFCYHGEIVRAGLRKKVPLYKETFRHAKPRKAIRKPRKLKIAEVRIASSRGHEPRQEILCRRRRGMFIFGGSAIPCPKAGGIPAAVKRWHHPILGDWWSRARCSIRDTCPQWNKVLRLHINERGRPAGCSESQLLP